jgi:hypothetical protein
LLRKLTSEPSEYKANRTRVRPLNRPVPSEN